MNAPRTFEHTADFRAYLDGLAERLVAVIDDGADDEKAILETYELLKGSAPWLIGEYSVNAFSADELLGGLHALAAHVKK